MIGHIKPGQLIILLSLSQSTWNTRFYFGHQKPCMDNNHIYSEYDLSLSKLLLCSSLLVKMHAASNEINVNIVLDYLKYE